MLFALEALVNDLIRPQGISLADDVAAGAVLYAVYNRARNSDVARIKAVELDVEMADGKCSGYIDSVAYQLKTSNTREKKTRFVPMAAPATGMIADVVWFANWVEKRRKAGLEDFPTVNQVTKDRTVDPVFAIKTPKKNLSSRDELSAAEWQEQPLTADAIAHWMRTILIKIGFAPESVEQISSHGFKATLLSWLAKVGAAKSDRLLLGGHVAAGDMSLLTYSRDALAGPLRVLDNLLKQVRTGEFLPNSSRSGRFPANLLDVEERFRKQIGEVLVERSSMAVLPIEAAESEDESFSPVMTPPPAGSFEALIDDDTRRSARESMQSSEEMRDWAVVRTDSFDELDAEGWQKLIDKEAEHVEQESEESDAVLSSSSGSEDHRLTCAIAEDREQVIDSAKRHKSAASNSGTDTYKHKNGKYSTLR